MRLALFILFMAAGLVNGSTFYVATNGSNGNVGSQGSPWLTIQRSVTNLVAGDIVRVQAGTYNERVAITNKANSGAWLNWVCDGTVICRGFDLTAVQCVRFTGFEITHTATTWSHGFDFHSACSYVDLIDNYIHEIKGSGTHNDGGGSHHLTMRGNRVYYMDFISGVYTNFSAYGLVTDQTGGGNVVEYNTVQRCADVFLAVFGTNCVIRNNYAWDFKNSYWGGDNSVHSDTFQPGSDGVQLYCRNHLVERNLTGDCTEANSHFGIWQDSTTYGDTNIIIRGNVGYNFGSGGIGAKSTDKVTTYNNTFYDMCNAAGSGDVFTFYKDSMSSDYPLNGLIANSVVHTMAGSDETIYIQPGSTGTTATRNIGYLCTAHASFVSTSDPKFVSPTTPTRNFRLQATSPAISAGTNLVWVTSASSSGTTFTVNDGQLLMDGWGLVDGDTITMGGVTTRISSIATNTVTVTNSVTWTNLMQVHWGALTNEDIGAFTYGSTALTGATISQSGTTYTVNPTGDARGVWFYVDGIPTTWVSTSPYSATIASGAVTAKAYALFAQSSPVVTASLANVTTNQVTVGGNVSFGRVSF